jgi:hypothetical protein
MTYKYDIGDVVKVQYSFEEVIGVIIEIDMWDMEPDYTITICGIPNSRIKHLEYHIIGKV